MCAYIYIKCEAPNLSHLIVVGLKHPQKTLNRISHESTQKYIPYLIFFYYYLYTIISKVGVCL